MVQIGANLDAVSDGVAEIQHPSQTCFLLVLLHHALLNAQGTDNDVIEIFLNGFVFQESKQLFIAGQRHLDGLRQPVGNLSLGQGFQQFGIDQHLFRLIEGTHDIFNPAEIDGGLAADGRVNLGQQGGGNIVKINPPHIRGGGKARQVAYHTAANSHHAILAGKAVIQHSLQKGSKHIQAFGGFALRDGADDRLFALRCHRLGILCRHTVVGDHQHPPIQMQMLTGVGEDTALNEDSIAETALQLRLIGAGKRHGVL